MNSKRCRLAALLAGAALLTGCDSQTLSGWSEGFTASAPRETATMASPALQTKYHASDEDVQEGLAQLNAGNFGLAQERLQKGVERSPNDLAGWIGLAASYDRLRRFDLADRAYAQAMRLGGVNAAILNNQGYSYLLRGDLVKARSSFLAARTLDPDSPTINNNLRLLGGSRRHVKRLETAY